MSKRTTMWLADRRAQETVTIGDDIAITLMTVQGNHVRFGIAAPRHIAVYREEIYRLIQDRNREQAVELQAK